MYIIKKFSEVDFLCEFRYQGIWYARLGKNIGMPIESVGPTQKPILLSNEYYVGIKKSLTKRQ